MTRVLAYLVVIGVVLYLAAKIASLLIVGAIGLLLLAWRRPAAVEPVIHRPQLSRLPEWARATPMRFAASAAFVTFLLVGISTSAVGREGEADPTPTPQVAAAEATATPTPTLRPTPTATPRPTRRPTPEATPTPEPTPKLGDAPTGPTAVASVVRVIDGDTIVVLIDGEEFRVRYIGIDTPETQSGPVEWMGAEASAANAQLVAGREVVLEKDVSETDRYGRLLRYVWVEDGDDWLLVNLELLRLGFAQVTTYPPDVKYVDELYLPVEREARDAGLGLWGAPPTPQPTPVPTPPPTPAPTPVPVAPQPPPSNCHPSYTGACLGIGIGDYDCAGGSGNGPNYVSGPVYVIGYDEFDLDRDGDGVACEWG